MKIHERLRQARLQAGYKTSADFARQNNIFEGTYRSHESGNRGLTRHSAITYAKLLGISVEWLLSGEDNKNNSLRDSSQPHFAASIAPATSMSLPDKELHKKAYTLAKKTLKTDNFEKTNDLAWKMVGFAKQYGEDALNKKLAEWLVSFSDNTH